MQGSNPLVPGKSLVPVLGEFIPRGDGSFIWRPRYWDSDLDTWITVSEAARIVGPINARVLYEYLGEFLVYRRPLPRKVLVSLKSALAFKTATQDVEFWDNPVLQQRCRDQVQKKMTAMREAAAKI